MTQRVSITWSGPLWRKLTLSNKTSDLLSYHTHLVQQNFWPSVLSHSPCPAKLLTFCPIKLTTANKASDFLSYKLTSSNNASVLLSNQTHLVQQNVWPSVQTNSPCPTKLLTFCPTNSPHWTMLLSFCPIKLALSNKTSDLLSYQAHLLQQSFWLFVLSNSPCPTKLLTFRPMKFTSSTQSFWFSAPVDGTNDLLVQM